MSPKSSSGGGRHRREPSSTPDGNASRPVSRRTVLVVGVMQAFSGRLPDLLLLAGLTGALGDELGVGPGTAETWTRGWLGAALGVVIALARGGVSPTRRGLVGICFLAAAGLVASTLAGVVVGDLGLHVVFVTQCVVGIALGMTLTLRPAALAGRSDPGDANLAIERISSFGGALIVLAAGLAGWVFGWRAGPWTVAAVLLLFAGLVWRGWHDFPNPGASADRTWIRTLLRRGGVRPSLLAGAALYAAFGMVLIEVGTVLNALGMATWVMGVIGAAAAVVASLLAGVWRKHTGPAPRGVAIAGFGWMVGAIGVLALADEAVGLWPLAAWPAAIVVPALAGLALATGEFARSPVKSTTQRLLQRLNGGETPEVAGRKVLLYWVCCNLGAFLASVVPHGLRLLACIGVVAIGVIALTVATHRSVRYPEEARPEDVLTLSDGSKAVELVLLWAHTGSFTLAVSFGSEWRGYGLLGVGDKAELRLEQKGSESTTPAPTTVRDSLLGITLGWRVPGLLFLWRRARTPDGRAHALLPELPHRWRWPQSPLRVRLRRKGAPRMQAVVSMEERSRLDPALQEALRRMELQVEYIPYVMKIRLTSPDQFGLTGRTDPSSAPQTLRWYVARDSHHARPAPPPRHQRRGRRRPAGNGPPASPPTAP